MPAPKPSSMNSRNKRKDDLEQRRAFEDAALPKTHISCTPPPSLDGFTIAAATWTRIINLQNETQTAQAGSPIITAFDENLLIDYCMMIEEVGELQVDRREIRDALRVLTTAAKKIKIKDNGYEYFLEVWSQVNKLAQNFKGIDSRLDTKRAHIKKAAESLYLTPRSRAGVAPAEKPPEKPKTGMDKLLE